METVTPVFMQIVSDCGVASLKRDTYNTSPVPKAQGSMMLYEKKWGYGIQQSELTMEKQTVIKKNFMNSLFCPISENICFIPCLDCSDVFAKQLVQNKKPYQDKNRDSLGMHFVFENNWIICVYTV